MLRLAWLCWILMLPPVWASEAKPLLVRSTSVGQLFRLNPTVIGIPFDGEARSTFEASRTYANIWARDFRYLIDAEVVDDQARLALRLAEWLHVGFGLTARHFAVAQTDQVAITAHDILMIGQDGRLEVGKHKTRYKIPDYSLEYSKKDRGLNLSEQITGDVSVPLYGNEASQWRLSGTALGSYEMSRASPYFAGAKDWGLQINGRYALDQGAAFGAITRLHFDQSQEVAVATRPQQGGWVLGYLHRFNHQQEFVSQFMVYQSVFRQMGQLSRNSYEVHFGYRHYWSRLAFELTLIENVFYYYNSPDWGINLGLRSIIF